MSAQDQTFEQYQGLMQINAASHLIRVGRQAGLLSALREGQRTLDQLCEQLSLVPESTSLLLDGLVATGIIEKYEDDFALSRAAHLLCQYDQDLGDSQWEQLASQLKNNDRANRDDQLRFNYQAATQWIHTPAAMQAAEILDIGGEGEVSGPKILDLGCGSAVWSIAMAHQDPEATILAVDISVAIEAATNTAQSIGLGDRFQTLEVNPADPSLRSVEFPKADFDIVLLAQRISGLGSKVAEDLLKKSIEALKPNGRLVVIDLFRGPTKPNLAESAEALKLDLSTQEGHIRTLESTQALFAQMGLQRVQFAFLAASKVNMGMAVGEKPSS